MIFLITEDEIKGNGFVNANLEPIYLNNAIRESQEIWLREVIGDTLLTKLKELVETKSVSGIYGTLLDEYVKIFLTYKTLSLLCIPLTFKIRNSGVLSQYSNEISTTTLDETKYLESYYEQKADFFRNRLSKFLSLHTKDIPEYRYCCKQVTNPEPSHPVCSIFLGK